MGICESFLSGAHFQPHLLYCGPKIISPFRVYHGSTMCGVGAGDVQTRSDCLLVVSIVITTLLGFAGNLPALEGMPNADPSLPAATLASALPGLEKEARDGLEKEVWRL